MRYQSFGLRPVIALATATIITLTATSAGAAAIVPDQFNDHGLGRNDDGSTYDPVDLGFTANFFGQSFDAAYVNNNGNITLDLRQSTYTPYDLTSTGRRIIAPFFADVDTSFYKPGKEAHYGKGTFDGRDAFGVNWIDVDYYQSSPDHTNLNSFQLILVDRSDIADGDFDIVFNYDKIQWEAGTASEGDENGLGGTSARVGYSNGTGEPGTFFELDGSAINGAFLDNGPLSTSLIHNRLNSDIDGRYIFGARNGTVTDNIDPQPADVPEPSSLAVLLIGLMILVPSWGRRQRRTF